MQAWICPCPNYGGWGGVCCPNMKKKIPVGFPNNLSKLQQLLHLGEKREPGWRAKNKEQITGRNHTKMKSEATQSKTFSALIPTSCLPCKLEQQKNCSRLCGHFQLNAFCCSEWWQSPWKIAINKLTGKRAPEIGPKNKAWGHSIPKFAKLPLVNLID